MTIILGLLFAVFVGGVLLTLMLGLRAQKQMQILDQEQIYAAGTAFTLEDVELGRPMTERLLKPIGVSLLRFLARLAPQRNVEDMQHKLDLAGRPFGWTVADLLGMRALAALILAGLTLVLVSFAEVPFLRKLLLAIVCGLLGYYLPLLWLNRLVRQRKSAIFRALPDGLDMLNICVGAGLGFDAGLSRVGHYWSTPLSEEFNRTTAEMRLGKTRREALQALARRTEVPEIENFCATIIQADQLGVSIAKVLRTQADQMRTIRRQRAEELARQATIKLLFPLVFLIFPAMLAVLLGPAIPQLLETFEMLSR